MVGLNPKMVPELSFFETKNDVQRLRRQEPACESKVQTMSRSQRMLRGNQNRRARSENAVVEFADRRPGVLVGFDDRISRHRRKFNMPLLCLDDCRADENGGECERSA